MLDEKVVRGFLKLADRVHEIVESEETWVEKYHLLFGVSGLQLRIQAIRPITYVDPEKSHEDDVRAYAEAVANESTILRSIFDLKEPGVHSVVFGYDNSDEGVYLLCSCGWHSEPSFYLTPEKAFAMTQEHRRSAKNKTREV